MRLVVSTPGRFHSFDLAAQLEKKGALERIFTGYPKFKLTAETVSDQRVTSYCGLHAPLMASLRLPGQKWLAAPQRELFHLANRRFDSRVARNLPEADGVIALSGSGLMSGLAMRGRGGFYVCDRGSTHILYQQRLLEAEADMLGLRFQPAHPDTVARELAEYSEADAILTPSHFTYRSFVESGVPAEKLRLAPYGINTAAFSPRAERRSRFTVLFAGQTTYRKGLHYLLKAWKQWSPADAELRIAGGVSPEAAHLVRWAGGVDKSVTFLGRLDKAALAAEMGRAHVLILPSIEEGLAIVMAQAMSCGAPVIATENTGAETLLTDGLEGYIGPARSIDFLRSAMERMRADPQRTEDMGRAARRKAKTFGSAEAYGDRVCQALEPLIAAGRDRRCAGSAARELAE
jgi:glycosyltransferase involved in cell wall biosynthesis